MANGFDGPWNPICPYCGGYMHTGHTEDCPVTRQRERDNAAILEAFVRLELSRESDPRTQP